MNRRRNVGGSWADLIGVTYLISVPSACSDRANALSRCLTFCIWCGGLKDHQPLLPIWIFWACGSIELKEEVIYLKTKKTQHQPTNPPCSCFAGDNCVHSETSNHILSWSPLILQPVSKNCKEKTGWSSSRVTLNSSGDLQQLQLQETWGSDCCPHLTPVTAQQSRWKGVMEGC